MTEMDSTVKCPSTVRGLTGYFRDQVRRIDMVLVVRDDGDDVTEQIKIEYLTNAVKFGLELELEPGVMCLHKSLIFVKVHAPESVIEAYGLRFDILRNFNDKHIESVNSEGIVMRFIRRTNEKTWIKIVRNQYPRPTHYSTLERSMIVRRILDILPFGNYENYIGLKRLLQRKIILDAFPLHDGPYFLMRNQQPEQYNARQVLNSYWLGITNILRPQPLIMIYEYFGDRVAFFFTFYGFYTFSLIFPAVVGTYTVVDAYLDDINNNHTIENYENIYTHQINTNDTVQRICPRCRNFSTCPFLPIRYYTRSMWLHSLLDQPKVDNMAAVISLWAILFMVLWRRREKYWLWMWEIKPDFWENSVRPEFIYIKKQLKGFNLQILYPIFRFIQPLLWIFVQIASLMVFSCIWNRFVMAAFLVYENRLFDYLTPNHFGYDDKGHYAVLSIFVGINVVIIFILELVTTVLSYSLARSENHKRESRYERSYVTKLFGLNFVFTMPMFIYYAFYKGKFYTYPSDPETLYKLEGAYMRVCNPLGCYDELALSLIVTIFLKEVMIKILIWIYNFLFMRTEYDQRNTLNVALPCWEREYRLPTLLPCFLNEKYKSLAMQFVLAILFVIAFPFAPLVIICMNILDIRFTARKVLKGFRRPLLGGARGVGCWRTVFTFLAFAAIFVNMLIVTLTSSKFRISEAPYAGESLTHRRKPHFLSFPLSVRPPQSSPKYSLIRPVEITGEACYMNGTEYKLHTEVRLYRLFIAAEFYVQSMVAMVCFAVLLYYIIPSCAQDVRHTRALENIIIKKK